MRLLRRLFWLGALSGAAFGGYRVWRRRQSPPVEPPRWPPLPSEGRNASAATGAAAPTAVAPAAPVATAAHPPDATWVAAVDGACPDGYPVKANGNSGIFHVPGGRFYSRTVADRCYANAEDALADGYRPAKA
jgi:hypothetical protein